MKLTNIIAKKTMSYLLAVTLVLSMVFALPISASAAVGTSIDYAFSGENADDPGYAQGTITLSSDTDGTYYLYWADDAKALEGYYEIDEFTVSNGKSASFEFGDHTAIPAGATKIIAVSDNSDLTVSNAEAVYSIPADKQLNSGSGKLLYTFNSYSDVHIDTQGYYVNAEKNWAQALQFAVDKDTDFIVSSGDMVTNAAGPESEWLVYEKVLAESDYVNPVWESDGNHDMRSGVSTGLTSFVRASGTDNTIANYDANKPYYYVVEQSTGDVFIFMALESDSNPSSCDEFSEEQMQWLTNLLDTYYGTGVNVYIIEHSPIKGFGAGDRMDNPYYKAHLSENYISTVQFKALLRKYPKLIWMSGHTHEDYTMGYNYSNENGTACHMIHNPAVAGSTWASPSASSLDYNNGIGYNSQGYYVETYENQVVFYGANLTDELIYPEYCYIMDGSRNTTADATNPTEEASTQSVTDATGETGSTLPQDIETQRVYFANTLQWQFVDCYSWSDADTSTCVWPGYAATYYGTSEQGVDLYYCDVPADHDKIIWNNAGNGYQTVNITLDGVNDFFTPSTTTSSKSVPVTASVWDYNPVTDPTDPTETTTAPAEESEYVLCYYNSANHNWTDIDTYLEKQSDGTYTLDFTAENSENISCNIYNVETKAYNCVAASTALKYASGETNTYSLSASSSRGKSITISGLSEGLDIKFIYNPADNSLTITCGEAVVSTTEATEPTEATTEPTEASTEETTQPDTTVLVDYKLGDVNMDGDINIDDATLVQKHAADLIILTDEQITLADVDFDNKITILDVTFIQKYVADMITEFTLPASDSDDSTEASESAESEYVWTASTLSEALAAVKLELEEKYTFSSYDQYQNLKKYYYRYKDVTSVDNEDEVVAEFKRLSEELNTIAEHIGFPKIYTVGNIYYFENTNNWTTVNCYAWNGSSEYAVWPGLAMQKVGTNNGHDVYGVKFDYAGQYTSLIFNNGSSQTVDIALNTFEFNCFSLDGTSSSGKLNVTNFSYTSDIEPTVAPTTTKPVSSDEHYALCYYNAVSHGWSDIDTFLIEQSDGTYALDFIATNSENISCNIFDNSSSTYNCVAASTSLAFASDVTTTYSLASSSSRGKSITISGLSEGSVIRFVYNPTDNTLTVTCSGVASTEPSETTDEDNTTPSGEDVTYILYMAPEQSSIDSGCTFKANVKDSAGAYHSYTFEKTDFTYNGSAVYKTEIVNPTYDSVTKIQFQTWDSANAFAGQVVDENSVSISYYNNKIMVCTSATSGTINGFLTD